MNKPPNESGNEVFIICVLTIQAWPGDTEQVIMEAAEALTGCLLLAETLPELIKPNLVDTAVL